MCDKKVKYITTLKEIRVMNDPYRREIMTALRLLGKPSTAKDVADFLGEPPSKVNYHIGILSKYEYIELDHTENINGIIAKFYCMSNSVFKIKMDGRNSKSKEIAAVRDIVASTFDGARDVFITQLAKMAEQEKDKEKSEEKDDKKYEDDLLFSRKVYMSEEDLKKVNEMVDKLANNAKEGKKLYSFFSSYVELTDSDE